jgi:hypothetical protein
MDSSSYLSELVKLFGTQNEMSEAEIKELEKTLLSFINHGDIKDKENLIFQTLNSEQND